MKDFVQHKENMKCLEGSFLVEGIKLSSNTKENLNKIANGEMSYKQVIFNITQKYKQNKVK